jgi:hypothetical protein
MQKLTRMHLIVGIGLVIYLFNSCNPKTDVLTPTYKTGEVLMPSYALPDTVLVIDGKGLTQAIRECDGSDLEIASAVWNNGLNYDDFRDEVTGYFGNPVIEKYYADYTFKRRKADNEKFNRVIESYL